MSSARAGCGHHRWARVPAQSGGRSRHVSCASAEWVGGEVDGADIVTVDKGALRQQSVELLK
jgi:hypothetical protein